MSAKLWKGAAIGAASGLLGAVVMNLVPTIWSKFEPPKPEKGPEAEGDDATVKTAERIAEPILKRPLSGEEKRWAARSYTSPSAPPWERFTARWRRPRRPSRPDAERFTPPLSGFWVMSSRCRNSASRRRPAKRRLWAILNIG